MKNYLLLRIKISMMTTAIVNIAAVISVDMSFSLSRGGSG